SEHSICMVQSRPVFVFQSEGVSHALQLRIFLTQHLHRFICCVNQLLPGLAFAFLYWRRNVKQTFNRPNVSHHHMTMPRQSRHNIGWSNSILPELLPVVEIDRYLEPHRRSRLDTFRANLRHISIQRRADCTEVKPFATLQCFFPIYHSALESGKGRVCSVVDHSCSF